MSGRKRGFVVTRSYSPHPDSCSRALRLLLEVSKKAARPGRPDARKEDPNASGSVSISRWQRENT